jgi:hypothetical protein
MIELWAIANGLSVEQTDRLTALAEDDDIRQAYADIIIFGNEAAQRATFATIQHTLTPQTCSLLFSALMENER